LLSFSIMGCEIPTGRSKYKFTLNLSEFLFSDLAFLFLIRLKYQQALVSARSPGTGLVSRY
jgi:hypothetical protein